MHNRNIYVAAKTFRTDLGGKIIVVVAGKTFVREGHPLLVGREHLFVKVVPQYEVEEPKPAPRKKPEPKAKSEYVEVKAVTELPDED